MTNTLKILFLLFSHNCESTNQSIHNIQIIGGKVHTLLECRVGPDIRIGRISGQISEIKTIRISDIRLIYDDGYPVIQSFADIERWSDIRPDIRHLKSVGYYVSSIRPKKYPAQQPFNNKSKIKVQVC